MTTNEQYLKVNEAANVARLSEYRLRQLLREGKLSGVRPGGRGSWRISLSSIRRYLGEPASDSTTAASLR